MQATPNSGASERGLLLALAVCGVDVVLIGTAAAMSNSLTLLSDSLKEGTDFLAVLASWLAVRTVRRNRSERFGYGIGKLENLASMLIALLMVACALYILVHALERLRHPVHAEGTLPGLLLFVVYAVIGFFIWNRNRMLLKMNHSPVVQSQMRLWFSKAVFDVLMAAALAAGLLFHDHAWSLYLDPVASLVGVVLMVHAAWAITSSSVGDLLDAALEENLQMVILKHLVDHFEDYEQLHQVRARRSGPNIYVDIFLQFDDALRMGEVQRRIDAIRADIGVAIPGAQVALVPTTAAPGH
jgi:cation diffusion facilitator family transporter